MPRSDDADDRSDDSKRATSAATRTLVEVNVALARLDERVGQMSSAIREDHDDHRREIKNVADRMSEVRDRVELTERTSSSGMTALQVGLERVQSGLASSLEHLTSTLSSNAALRHAEQARLMDVIAEAKERERKREEREDAERVSAREAAQAREEREAVIAAASVARKDQWMLRFWERVKQPMLMLLMGGAGVAAAWLGRCGGG